MVLAALPLAAGGSVAATTPSPFGIVLFCGVVGLIDIKVRGERILWANLGVTSPVLYAIYAAPAIPAEVLLTFVRR